MTFSFILLLIEVFAVNGYYHGNRGASRRGLIHMLDVQAAPTTTGLTFQSPNTAARAVAGMCGDQQYSMGSMSSAATAGITSPETCGAYVSDFNRNAKNLAVYMSYSKTEDKCMWYRECGCLASSSTCPGGDVWVSVALSDIFVIPTNVIATADPLAAKSATVVPNTAVPTPAAPNQGECDTSSTNLMQTFQSQCEMSQNVTFARLVAGIVLGAVLIVVGGIFGYAYWLDREEILKVSTG